MAINLKQYFADALIDLSKEMPLSKITIRDIVAKVGAGRQTFYNHFKDKNDLIYWIYFRTLIGERKILQSAGFFTYLISTYTKTQSNADFFKEAVKLTGQNSLADAILNQVYQYYKRLVQESAGQEEIDAQMEAALFFNAYGAANLFIKWCREGCPGSPVDQARYAIHCIPTCIKQHLPLNADERMF